MKDKLTKSEDGLVYMQITCENKRTKLLAHNRKNALDYLNYFKDLCYQGIPTKFMWYITV